MEVVERSIDGLGRLVIPAKWRKGVTKVVLLKEEDSIRILPKRKGSFLKLLGTIRFSDAELSDIDRLIAESSA